MTLETRAIPEGSRRPAAHGLKRYYQTLRENWWLVALCLVITIGAAAAYAELAPRKYQAEAQMLVEPVAADNTTLIGLPLLFATSDPTSDVLTAASLMTTPGVASSAISALHLGETPDALLNQITATPIGQSNLVAIQATASSAQQAQTLANGFADAVIRTRAATLRAAIKPLIPGLQARLAGLPPADRAGPGTVGGQLQQLQQLESTGDPTITLASHAQLPTAPYSPKRSLALIAGLIAGLVLGFGAALARHALDPRLRREEQLRDLLGLPILARIPRERPRRGDQPMLPHELSVWAQEGYRTLRTVLSSRSMGERTIVLVTSSSPAEGKTTSAISLAVTLAQGGSRVTLIEADLRRPTMASNLGFNPSFGTEDVLVGRAQLSDALVTIRFGATKLQVLAVRRSSIALVDHLSFGVAERLIGDAARNSDFVVIDSPPLTTVIDALPLAQVADEVLIVARLGVSRLNRLSDLHNLLVENENYPSGVLLIGESVPDAGEYYYSPDDRAASSSGSNNGARSDELAPVAAGQE